MRDLVPDPVAVQRRQYRLLFAVGSAAIVLAGAGVQFALSRSDSAVAAPVEPTTVFAVLDAPQTAQDVVASDELRYTVHPETTRYLGQGPLGAYFLGVSLTGDACLITAREERTGLVADAGCASLSEATNGVVLESEGPGDDAVALVADGFVAPSGWHAVSANLVVRDA